MPRHYLLWVSIIPTLPKSAIFYCIQLIYLNRPNSIRKDQYILDFISLALIMAYKSELMWQYLTKSAYIRKINRDATLTDFIL